MSASDYQITVKVRNARILRLMRERGFTTFNALAKAAGVGATLLGEIINLKETPIDARTGEYRAPVWRIADVLFCHPDDMFTDKQREGFRPKELVIEVTEAEVETQLAALEVRAKDPEKLMIEQNDTKSVIYRALKHVALTPRQRKVLIMRFDLDGKGERTFDEIAAKYGVTREMARIIVDNALDKLGGAAGHTAGLHAHMRELTGKKPKITPWDYSRRDVGNHGIPYNARHDR
jgi:hypothetical protein